jgi:hypothetical protein
LGGWKEATSNHAAIQLQASRRHAIQPQASRRHAIQLPASHRHAIQLQTSWQEVGRIDPTPSSMSRECFYVKLNNRFNLCQLT